MKLSLGICTFLWMSIQLCQAQVVINEIMYNPPEAGTDYLEFIELYNPGNSDIPLKDYKIKDGVTYTFPDTIIKAGSFYVICGNQQKFDSIFGFKPAFWTGTSALANGGELVSIADPGGNLVDSVRYSPGLGGWNSKANGQGYSLELCRATADNSQAGYWKPSNRNTGFSIDGKQLFASPNIANNVECAEYTIGVTNNTFNPAQIEIFQGEHIEWQNISGVNNVNGNLSTFPLNPEGFGNGSLSGSNWSYVKRFDIVGTYQYQSDSDPNQLHGIITVKPLSGGYPVYPIGVVTSVNSLGDADSLNINCQLDGVVYGVNLRPQGLQFTLIDQYNDGIAVFSPNKNYSYTVKEGDKVSVRGSISQFNGLIQITPITAPDTIIYISSGNKLVDPTVVTNLNELTESQLVTIKNVHIENPITWSNNPTGFTTRVTDGVNSYEVRIDNDVDLVSKKAPGGTFNITGIGSQFDGASPYFDGYQLMPRYISDINPYDPEGGFYQALTIGKVTTSNIEGKADSLGVKCELTGIVYGIDLNGNQGLQFTIIDATGGIGVFSGLEFFGYDVKEGDLLTVRGTIDQFRGLTQINLDTLWKLSSDNPLKSPSLVSKLDESTESELVELKNLTLVNPSEWKGDGSSFNVTLTDGLNQFVMRIDDNTDISSSPASGTKLNLIGLGGQFDSTDPLTGDYQILPRYSSDLHWITANQNVSKDGLILYPNPVRNTIYIQDGQKRSWSYELLTTDGRTVKHGFAIDQVNVVDLPPGMYLLRMANEELETYFKIIK